MPTFQVSTHLFYSYSVGFVGAWRRQQWMLLGSNLKECSTDLALHSYDVAGLTMASEPNWCSRINGIQLHLCRAFIPRAVQGFCCSFSHSDSDDGELPRRQLARPSRVQCVAQGHLNMWTGGSDRQPCDQQTTRSTSWAMAAAAPELFFPQALFFFSPVKSNVFHNATRRPIIWVLILVCCASDGNVASS